MVAHVQVLRSETKNLRDPRERRRRKAYLAEEGGGCGLGLVVVATGANRDHLH